MEWLKQGLANSDAHFKVILNSVPITKYGWGMETLGGSAAKDRWIGYEAQREEILHYIATNSLSNIWWLTGDFHLGQAGRIEGDGPRSYMWEIMVGPSYSYPNPLGIAIDTDPTVQQLIAPAPQFEYFSSKRAISMITFDPLKDAVRVTFISSDNGRTTFDKWLKWGPMTGEE